MKKGRRLAGVYSKPLSSSSANGLPIFFFRMRRDGVWFHDRGWPTDPLNPPVGDGLAALLLDRAARLFLFANVCCAFGYTLNVNRAARPLGVISGHAQHASIRPRCTDRRRIDRPATGITRYHAPNIWPVMQRRRLPCGGTRQPLEHSSHHAARSEGVRGRESSGSKLMRKSVNGFKRFGVAMTLLWCMYFLNAHWLEPY